MTFLTGTERSPIASFQDVKMDDVRAEAAVAVASATSYGWMVLVLGCASEIGRARDSLI